MPRPQRCRRVCSKPEFMRFEPDNYGIAERVTLTIDEYETIRLVDYLGLTHKECGDKMDVSRTTVTEIYERARHKIADSIVNGKTLVIEGGNYVVCGGIDCPECGYGYCHQIADRAKAPDASGKHIFNSKGEKTMRVAVTYEEGQIFQHFGHTQQFKIYDIEDGKVINEAVVDTAGSGHGALAGFLADGQVNALICGGIGGGAKAALAEAGIELYPGVSGSADEAAAAMAQGTLEYNEAAQCAGHGEGHQCGHQDQTFRLMK